MDSRNDNLIIHCPSGNAWMQTLEDSIQLDKLVVSMYYASWSSPSKAMYDVMLKLAAVENPNQVIFCKVDIDESKDISTRMAVRMVPTIIFTREGKEVGRIKSIVSIEHLQEKITSLLQPQMT